MAQLLMQGTNLVNFWAAMCTSPKGPRDSKPSPWPSMTIRRLSIGSDLQKIVYSDDYDKIVKHGRQIDEGEHHAGNVLDVQLRGEYLYAAMGKDGFRAFDVANVDNKNFSEKMTTAPVSPLGQRFYVKTKNATSVASPSTLAVDPLRTRIPANQEQAIALMYGFLYVTDSEEGLVVIGDPNLKSRTPGVLTLLDGNPTNNFLKRALGFNPGGVLNGARKIAIAGSYAYILCDRGLVVVDLTDPLTPKVTFGVERLQ